MPEFKKFNTHDEAVKHFKNMSLEEAQIYILHMKAKLTVTREALTNAESKYTLKGIIGTCNQALNILNNKDLKDIELQKFATAYLNNIYSRMLDSLNIWNVYNRSVFTFDEIKTGISESKQYLHSFKKSYLDLTTDSQRKIYESSLLYIHELERLINIGFEKDTYEPINNITQALIIDIESLRAIENTFKSLAAQHTEKRVMNLNTHDEDSASTTSSSENDGYDPDDDNISDNASSTSSSSSSEFEDKENIIQPPITTVTPSMMIKSQRENNENRSSEIIVPETVYNKGIANNKVKTKDEIYAVLATNDEGKEYAVAAYTKAKGKTSEERRNLAKATIAAALQNGAAQRLTIAYGSQENMKAAFMVCMQSKIGYVHPNVGDQNYPAYEQAIDEFKTLKAEDKVHYEISNMTVKEPANNITECKSYTADISSKQNMGIRSDMASKIKNQQQKQGQTPPQNKPTTSF